MKHKVLLVGSLVLICGLVVVLQPALAATITNSTITLGCTSYDWEFDLVVDRDNTGAGFEAYYFEIIDGAGKVLHRVDGAWYYPNAAHLGPATSPYNTALPDYNPLTYRVVSHAGNGYPEQVALIATGTCAGLPTYVAPATAAGRDMVDLPAQAVVGVFVQTTPLLFAPDANATTDTVMAVGKTLWVLGVDSTGMYYQVLMSGNTGWVPVSSMGPNFDDVWHGTPLPTTVVD